MKFGTQNQSFFPVPIRDKFEFLRDFGFDSFEIDGGLLVEHTHEVKQAIVATGLPVTTACGGYNGWIGDFNESRRLNGLAQIKQILRALQEVGGLGIVVPAAWGMFSYRLPPMTAPRDAEGDRRAVSASLLELDQTAATTGTCIFLEPLNRYQDHMINTLAQAQQYIEEYNLRHVKITADVYHMNIEEDNTCESLHLYRHWIGHIHLADNHRYQPGTGSLDFRKYFSQLMQDGYQGSLTLECRIRGADPQFEYAKSLAYLRQAAR